MAAGEGTGRLGGCAYTPDASCQEQFDLFGMELPQTGGGVPEDSDSVREATF